MAPHRNRMVKRFDPKPNEQGRAAGGRHLPRITKTNRHTKTQVWGRGGGGGGGGAPEFSGPLRKDQSRWSWFGLSPETQKNLGPRQKTLPNPLWGACPVFYNFLQTLPWRNLQLHTFWIASEALGAAFFVARRLFLKPSHVKGNLKGLVDTRGHGVSWDWDGTSDRGTPGRTLKHGWATLEKMSGGCLCLKGGFLFVRLCWEPSF